MLSVETEKRHHTLPGEKNIDLANDRLFVSTFFGNNFARQIESEQSSFEQLNPQEQRKVLNALNYVERFKILQDRSFWKKLIEGTSIEKFVEIDVPDDSRELAAQAFLRIYGVPRKLLGLNFGEYKLHTRFGEEKKETPAFEKFKVALVNAIGLPDLKHALTPRFINDYLAGQEEDSLILIVNSHLIPDSERDGVIKYLSKIKKAPKVLC